VGIPPGKDPVRARAEIAAAVAAGVRTKGNAYGYDRAFSRSPQPGEITRIRRLSALRSGSSDDRSPVVLDSFAGGGSIPFEAMRLGCDVIANELNPVASAILQGTLGVVHDFGADLAGDIRTWGNRWAEAVTGRLAPYFPTDASRPSQSYIWAFAVPCPTTGKPTPLAPNLWLARTDDPDKRVAVRLDVDREAGKIAVSIVEGNKASQFGDRATYKRGVGESVWARDTTFSGDYIQRQARAGNGTYILLAVCYQDASIKGRRFRSPNEADYRAIEAAEKELARLRPQWEVDGLIPDEPIQEGLETSRMPDMGVFRWSDAFMPRQLLANMVLLEELVRIQPSMCRELGDDRGRAVALTLSFALDRALDYNSRQCNWHAGRTMIRNTFDRHDFAFSWTCAEFESARLLVPWVANKAASIHQQLCRLVSGEQGSLDQENALVPPRVLRGNATAVDLPDGSVDAVITDPPYYDNVMYAELSDFFYVWLKRSLANVWPQFCDLAITDKQQEAVANPSLFRDVATHSGRGKRDAGARTAVELASVHYEDLLTKSFQEAHRVLSDGGVLNVMFTHKRVDAWDTLGAALLNSGFAVTSSWPISTESENALNQAKNNSAQSTILLNCHKRGDTRPAYWADIRQEVSQAAEEAVGRFSSHGLKGVDLTLATFGPVLGVLSRNWPVYTGELDSDGNPGVLRPDVALDLAREKVAVLKKRGLLGGKDVQFDRITDWWLLAWSDFQAAEFPAPEALKLSLATHLDLDTLSKTHKVIKASSGKVTLLTPAQRRTAKGLDVDAAAYESLIDALHALMLVYEEDGTRAAQAWLNRHDLTDDVRFKELVGAAIHAVPRRKLKGMFVRPEARVLDSLRTSFFDALDLPPDPDAELLAAPPALF
jgi:adenine-specific DNA methylase